MPHITIEMTEAELFALDLIAVNKQDWADNVLTNRARVAKEELKQTPEWAQAIAELAKAGGDVGDDWAVLLKGKELSLFKTAAEKQAEAEIAQATGIQPPSEVALSAEHVQQYAMALKMSLVGAPTAEAFKDILDNGTREGLRLMRIKDQRAWTEEEATRAAVLESVDNAISYLDGIAQVIAGEVADGSIIDREAMMSDGRWNLPT